jgi:energy-coupling factor transport system substrate-specific component
MSATTAVSRTGRLHAVRVRPRATVTLALVSLLGLVAFGWPLLVDADAGLAHRGDAPWLFVLLLPLLLAVVLAEMTEHGMDAKAVALLGVLAAVGAALRPLGGGVAGFETVFFLLVLGGRALGPGFGFVLGSVTLFASALLTAGVGPWLPFQMLAAGWVGLFAGLLPRARGWREVALLSAYGGVAGLAYGMLMNLWTWPFITGLESSLSYVAGDPLVENLQRFLGFTLATSLGFDIPRALTNAALIALTGRPVLLALRRASRKAAFAEPVTFEPSVVGPSTAHPQGVTDSGGRPTG